MAAAGGFGDGARRECVSKITDTIHISKNSMQN